MIAFRSAPIFFFWSASINVCFVTALPEGEGEGHTKLRCNFKVYLTTSRPISNITATQTQSRLIFFFSFLNISLT